MAKAATALTLGKDYRQDEALDWGFLTRPENSHRLARGGRSPESDASKKSSGGKVNADAATNEVAADTAGESP
ncbi:MAG TPA: hypothetical protein VGG30_06765, partial [Pirellulales bacterium]